MTPQADGHSLELPLIVDLQQKRHDLPIASAKISTYGATVISWKVRGQERLFLRLIMV